MRESIEEMKNSPSIFRRCVFWFCKFLSWILPAQKRVQILILLKRTIRYCPRYCRNVSDWGLNAEERSPRIIVSLTSYPKRIKTVNRVIVSILNQTLKPDKVVLWLGEDKFPRRDEELPQKLLELRKHGLTIGWCKDLRSYTKLIPALKDFPDDIIITVDDDTFYSPQLIEHLYQSYLTDTQSIHSTLVRQIQIGNDGKPLKYSRWSSPVLCGSKSFAFLLLGYSGVLYPPHVLDQEVFDECKFQSVAPYADDLWFWAMAVKAGTTIHSLPSTFGNQALAYDCCADQSEALMNKNVVGESLNDRQFAAIMEAYPEVKHRMAGACLENVSVLK